MKIDRGIEIVETIKQEKQIRELTNLFEQKVRIKNNRKKTKGRNIQKIVTITKDWPPVISVKYIKHRF
jgi:hypothetical protein